VFLLIIWSKNSWFGNVENCLNAEVNSIFTDKINNTRVRIKKESKLLKIEKFSKIEKGLINNYLCFSLLKQIRLFCVDWNNIFRFYFIYHFYYFLTRCMT